MLVNRSVDGNCDVVFTHSIQENRSANWYKQSRPIWHQSCCVLNNFNVFFIVINIESVAEFVEYSDSAGVRVTVQCISKEQKSNKDETSWLDNVNKFQDHIRSLSLDTHRRNMNRKEKRYDWKCPGKCLTNCHLLFDIWDVVGAKFPWWRKEFFWSFCEKQSFIAEWLQNNTYDFA